MHKVRMPAAFNWRISLSPLEKAKTRYGRRSSGICSVPVSLFLPFPFRIPFPLGAEAVPLPPSLVALPISFMPCRAVRMSKQGKKPIPTVVCLPPRCSGSAVMESWIGRRRLGVCDFIYVERDGYCFSFFLHLRIPTLLWKGACGGYGHGCGSEVDMLGWCVCM